MEKRDKSQAGPAHIKNKPKRPKLSPEQIRRIRFARSLTRSIFGRHYFDDAMAAELEMARLRPKKR